MACSQRRWWRDGQTPQSRDRPLPVLTKLRGSSSVDSGVHPRSSLGPFGPRNGGVQCHPLDERTRHPLEGPTRRAGGWRPGWGARPCHGFVGIGEVAKHFTSRKRTPASRCVGSESAEAFHQRAQSPIFRNCSHRLEPKLTSWHRRRGEARPPSSGPRSIYSGARAPLSGPDAPRGLAGPRASPIPAPYGRRQCRVPPG